MSQFLGALHMKHREYYAVRNLDRYQHYKRRRPPWIKLYQELLDDYDFTMLPDHMKWVACGLLLLASRMDNRIPANPEWISRALSCTEPIDPSVLLDIEFIKLVTPLESTVGQDASNPLASRTQSAIPETETETETETELAPLAARARDDESLTDLLLTELQKAGQNHLTIFATEKLLDGFIREFEPEEMEESIRGVVAKMSSKRVSNHVAYLTTLCRRGGIKQFLHSKEYRDPRKPGTREEEMARFEKLMEEDFILDMEDSE